VGWGPDKDNRYITTWFRHTFDRPDLKPGERLVINFCVDDGLVIYLNGREIGRENLPDGPLTPTTLAPRAIGPNDEGFYQRMPVPVDALRPGRNVLAVEVHQCSPKSHDIFLDLALETMPADFPTPPVPDAARAVVETFRYTNYVGPDTRIPDGYEDGGHAMRLDADRPPISGREILIVDRARDTGLGKDLAFAHSSELQALPPRERALRLATHIDEETTPPGGVKWAEPTCGLLEKEFKNKPVFLSDWIEQAHAGVCRHRALLFKVLAQEAGLKVALVRGHFVDRHLPDGGQHCWNELFLDDYQRVLVDVMMKGRKQDFPEVTSPAVVEHYRKQDNSPWYNPKVQ
jgi:hypothetical protein